MDQHSNPQSETLQASGALEFRVSRPGVPIRRLRLTGNRYTFGRDPAATVRLDDPTLQPVHALLLREVKGESERLVLQSMSDPLQVNDRLTTETTLHTGDHFQLGAFRFEFIGSVDAPLPSPSVDQKSDELPSGNEWASAEEAVTIRTDSNAKPSSPRLSFAAGMRLIDESESAAGTKFPTQPERTLDAIEQALSAETGPAELAPHANALRQQIEQTLREESQRALDRQKRELSQEHRREMETVLQRFAETQEQAASANRAIETMRQQVADLGKQLRNATEIKWEQQEAFERAGKERDEAREEVRQATAKSQRLISELDAARRDRSEISSSLHDITIQLYTATAEGDKAQRRARELARQREEAIQKVESFARRCEELTEQLRQAEQTCQTVSDQRDRFAEELRQRTAERDSAIALADQRSDELIAKESVIDKLRSQVTELEESVAESRREAEALRTECQAACDSVAKLEEVVRQGEQQRLADRASWEAESAELRASVEQISIELAAASGELTRSHETTDALNTELAETRAALTEAESEVAIRPSVDELQAIRERLEATEQQLRQLQSETEDFAGAVETLAEVSPEPDDENPTHTYAENPSTADAENPTEAAVENPPEGYTENPSTPPPWAIDLSNPWNLDSADLETSGQEEPLDTHQASREEYTAEGDQTPAIDQDADSNSLTWQSAEEPEAPRWEEPAAGSLASDLLKQLAEPADHTEPSAATSPYEMGGEEPNASADGNWDQYDASFPEDLSPHEPLPGDYDDDGESLRAEDAYENEPVMQEGEIEQVREFLRSEDPAADFEPSGEDESSHDEELDHHQPQALGSPETETESEHPPTSIVAGEGASSQDRYGDEADVRSTSVTGAAGSDEDDDSIEAYMNRLLQRVQGGDSGAYSPGQPTSANATDQAESNPRETRKEDAPEPATPEAPIDEDAPFIPRSQAPERSKNLAAMRELANSSARTAIMSSVRKQAHSTAIQKFVQAAGCAGGATVMLYFSQLKFGWQMIAAICMTLLAAYWVVEALQLQARLRTDGDGESTAADPTADVLQKDAEGPQEEDAAEPKLP